MTVGTILGYTTNYRLALLNPNARSWADEDHSNWTVVDTVLFALSGLSGILGAWVNSTAYIVGDRLIDTDGAVYQCAVANTSASTDTFTADRTANPTFWNLILNAPVSRGTWATGIKYNANDFVLDAGRYAVCNTTHTSTSSFDTDIANWDILIDVGNPFTIVDNNPALILEDDDASASDDFAGFKLTGAVALLEGTANGVLKFAGYGDVNLTAFEAKFGGAYHEIWTAGNDGTGSGLDADLLDGVEGSGYELALGYSPVDVAGDTMTGFLTLSGNATASLHAVTKQQHDLKAPLAGPVLTGDPKAPTASPGNNTVSIATTAFVFAGLALKAPLASPALTGTPTAPTPTLGDDSTKIATTAFVQAESAATRIVKTADETVNSSSTLQDDDHLVFAMAANITYHVDIILLLEGANTTADFKFGLAVPAGCTYFWEQPDNAPWGVGGSITAEALVVETDSPSTLKIQSDNFIHGGIFKAIVRNGANAGNLQLQWAQNTSNGSDNKVLKHSSMIIRELGAT